MPGTDGYNTTLDSSPSRTVSQGDKDADVPNVIRRDSSKSLRKTCFTQEA